MAHELRFVFCVLLFGVAINACVTPILLAQPGGALESSLEHDEFLTAGYFHAAVFSRDGKLLLTASGSNRPVAQMWDVETGKLVRTFSGHRTTIHDLAFNSDETKIATGSGNALPVGRPDAKIRVWNVATADALAVFETEGTFIGSVKWSPDSATIAATMFSSTSVFPHWIEVWSEETQERLYDITGVAFTSPLSHLREPVHFSPSGDLLVGLNSSATQIILWDAATGEALRAIQDIDARTGEPLIFNAPVFSPDGQSLLGICSDHTARRWDVETGRESVRFEGHRSRITAALYCDDDDRVWTSSEDGSVRAWNVQDGSELATFDHPGPVRELWVAASGSRVVSHWRHRLEDGSLKAWATVWDTETGRELTRIEIPLHHVRIAVRPQSTHVLVASQEHGSLLFDVETGDIVGNYVRDGFSKRSP